MEGQEIKFNQYSYNIFAICGEFRQRLEELHRLKEKVVKESADKNV